MGCFQLAGCGDNLAGALAPEVVLLSGLSALELRSQSMFLCRFQEVVKSLVNMEHLLLRGVSGGVLGDFLSLTSPVG